MCRVLCRVFLPAVCRVDARERAAPPGRRAHLAAGMSRALGRFDEAPHLRPAMHVAICSAACDAAGASLGNCVKRCDIFTSLFSAQDTQVGAVSARSTLRCSSHMLTMGCSRDLRP